MGAKVGSLNVDLTLGTARFSKGLTDAQRELAKSQKSFEALGSKMQGIGAKLSLGITANLLTFGNVSGKVFDDAQLAVVNISARMGTDLQAAAIMVGKALNDPVKGMKALTRAGIQFTDAQKEQIKSMVEQGNTAGAQAIMLGELNRQFAGAAKAQRDATPTAAAQQAWRTFQETVGGIAIKVLPPFTDMLTRALDAFNELSPGAQSTAVAVAAIAAAAGPVTATFGTLLKVGAPLLATFGAEGRLAAGLGGLTPILGPLAIAVAAVAAVWRNWDTIGPYIQGVVDRVKQSTADFDAFFDRMKRQIDELDRQMGTPTKDEMFASIGKAAAQAWSDLEKYDLAAWARGADAAIASFATDAWQSFERMHARVQAAFNAMVDGISTAITGRLSPTFGGLGKMVTTAGDYFHTLWDRVVGHSYVPDMVDAIAQHMARLDGVMVQPIAETTRKAGDSFAALRERLNGILDRVFPDQAEMRSKLADLGEIDKAIGAHVGDPATWAAARRKVLEEIDQLTAAANEKATEGLPIITDAPMPEARVPATLFDRYDDETGAAKAKTNALDLQAMLNQLKTLFGDLGAIGNGCFDVIAGAIDGGLIPGLGRAGEAVGALGSQMSSLADAFTSIFGEIFGKTGVGGVVSKVLGVAAGAFAGSFGGARAAGGPVVSGTSYLVGEQGPEIFTPRTAGVIIPQPAGGWNHSLPARHGVQRMLSVAR